ncbi:hypothetical protein Hdeb2414_s0065g00766311 [Helianthus debilis subsp. tardiflorus]
MGIVKSSKLETFRSDVDLALSLTEDEKRVIAVDGDNKRKRDETPTKDSKKGKNVSNYNQSIPF